MTTYVWDKDLHCMVDKDTGEPSKASEGKPSWLGKRVYGVADGCDPIKSMVDGTVYESKSAYRRHLKQNGYIEVGNDYNSMIDR